MLDRYKKKGGFNQLLSLIESSTKSKQEQFLSLVAQESPVWEEEVRKKLLTLDKILSWNPVYLGEVISRIQPLTLATAFHGMPKEQVEKIVSCIGISERRKIQQVIDESNPTPGEVSTCVLKIIIETRALIQNGILKMDKIDPEMMILDNIEEHLNVMRLNKSLEEGAHLVFPPSTPEPKADSPQAQGDHKADSKSDHGRDEIDFLKKKVNQLVGENATLKQELSVLRGKLDQIKKIA